MQSHAAAQHSKCATGSPGTPDAAHRLQRRPLRANVVTRAAKQAAPKGTQKTNAGTQLASLLGTIRLGLGTQQGKAYKPGKRDDNVVFVAGCTGNVGSRTVRELLAQGFKVRAGAREPEQAYQFLRNAIAFGLLPKDAEKQITVVNFDLEDPDSLPQAIGNASKVVQAIGAAEAELLNWGLPKRIDGDGAINLIKAAEASGVSQYLMVTSIGTGKIGWPSVLFNLAGGLLVQKRRAEKVLEESSMSYLIVRPGGMERPGDDYDQTHNLTLKTRDTAFGGQVSCLQVARLMATAARHPGDSENMVVELVAEEDAPRLGYLELLQGHPSDISQADKAQAAEAREQAAAATEAARAQLAEAQEEAQEAASRTSQLQQARREAEQELARIQSEAEPVMAKAEQLQEQVQSSQRALEEAKAREEAACAVLAAAKEAAKQQQTLTREEQQSIGAPILQAQAVAEDAEDQKSTGPTMTLNLDKLKAGRAKSEKTAVLKAREASEKLAVAKARSVSERVSVLKAREVSEKEARSKARSTMLAEAEKNAGAKEAAGQNGSSQSAAPQNGDKPENVSEAANWIDSWRSRTGG